MSTQLKKILKSLAGEYLVAAHLTNMGYLVTITPRGLPKADLLVHDIKHTPP